MTAAVLVSPFPPGGSSTSYSLAASLSPTSLTQTSATSTITTAGSCTATPTGGSPPYSFAWADDDNLDNIQLTAPTAASTQFRKSSAVSGNDYFGTFFCVVTDALGSKASTGDVSITITRS